MQKWLFLTAAIASEVTGSLALKAAVENPAFYALVAAGYFGSFLGPVSYTHLRAHET